jgi:hypothetical protein
MAYKGYIKQYKNSWVGNNLTCECVQVVYKNVKYK